MSEPLPGIPDPLLALSRSTTTGTRAPATTSRRGGCPSRSFLDTLEGAAVGGARLRRSAVGCRGRAPALFLRLGGADPETEPTPPAETDDPEWVAVTALLSGTGLPFEAASRGPRESVERRDERAQHGRWLARWPGAAWPTAIVTLTGPSRTPTEGSMRALETVRSGLWPHHVAVLRCRWTIVALLRHDLTPEEQVWCDRVRAAFADADAAWSSRTVTGRCQVPRCWPTGSLSPCRRRACRRVDDPHLAGSARLLELLRRSRPVAGGGRGPEEPVSRGGDDGRGPYLAGRGGQAQDPPGRP